MSALATILRRDLKLSGEELDRVVQREKEEGGNLDTAILELNLLAENVVHAYCAAVYSLSPATRDEIMNASSEVVRSLTGEFALRHRALPIERNEHSVVLAVDRPLPEETLREIATEAKLEPLQRVAATARIDAGLAQHFGIELSARIRALIEALEPKDPGTVPYVAPYEGLVTRSSLPPRGSVRPTHSSPGIYSMVSASAGGLASDRVRVPSAAAKDAEWSAGGYHLGAGDEEILGRPTAPPPGSSRPQALNGQGEHGADAAASLEDIPTGQVPIVSEGTPYAVTIDELDPDLPSVVVGVGEDIEQLVEALQDANMQTVEAYSKALVSTGELALPALVAAFPGTLWTDRQDHLSGHYPPGQEISAVANAFCAFEEVSIPYVVSLLDHEADDARYYATLLASEFSDGRMVFPVGRRLFDVDLAIREIAIRALRNWQGFDMEYRRLLERLRAVAIADRDDASRCAAIEALGGLGDVGSLDILMDALENASPDAVSAAHASLIQITYQDFGTAKKRWKAWIEKNRSKHRVDWLIDSLMHTDASLRSSAGQELAAMAQETFGFDPVASKKERSSAQRKYRSWWRGESTRQAAS